MSNNPLFDGEGIEFAHLQRVSQQRQTAEVKRLLEEQARQRRGVCPCPHCGGGIPQAGVSVCMHCRRELHWQNGFCAGTKEKAQSLAKDAAQKAADARARSDELLRATAEWRAAKAEYEASPEGQRELRKKQLRRNKETTCYCLFAVGFLLTVVGLGLFVSPTLYSPNASDSYRIAPFFYVPGFLAFGLTALLRVMP